MTNVPLTTQNKRRYLNAGLKTLMAMLFVYVAMCIPKFAASQVLGWHLFALSLASLAVAVLFLWHAMISLHATHDPKSTAN